MTNFKCDLTNPEYNYAYCPSYPAAVLFAILFSLTTTGHVYQAIQHRKPFAVVLIMGGTWEVLGYIIRTVSIQSPFTSGLYTAQMLLILLAPLWINAFIYMLMGRMIHFFLEDDRVFGIKARKTTLIFVVFDIIAFLVQGTGGSMTASDNMDTALTGLHVYTAGVALQIGFNVFFLAIVGQFHRTAKSILPATESNGQGYAMSSSSMPSGTLPTFADRKFKDCIYLLRLVYGIVGLIFFRNFYRLAEFASGLDSTILKHEWYAYVFDAVPMLAAMIIINVFYPGRKLQGARCDFTEENKATKQAKKDKKTASKNGQTTAVDSKVPFVLSREISDDGQV